MNDPERYENESTHEYKMRCLRWKKWARETRQDFWFTSESEIRAWKEWLENGAASN